MKLWTTLPLPAAATISRNVSSAESEEALSGLEGSPSVALPTSVLPHRIQELLDRGESVDLAALAPVTEGEAR